MLVLSLFEILSIYLFQLALAKIMDQGPVLIMTFQAQQVSMLTDKKGKAVEGGIVSVILILVLLMTFFISFFNIPHG